MYYIHRHSVSFFKYMFFLYKTTIHSYQNGCMSLYEWVLTVSGQLSKKSSLATSEWLRWFSVTEKRHFPFSAVSKAVLVLLKVLALPKKNSLIVAAKTNANPCKWLNVINCSQSDVSFVRSRLCVISSAPIWNQAEAPAAWLRVFVVPPEMSF